MGPYCSLTTDWDPVNKTVGTIMRWTSANATMLSIAPTLGSVALSGNSAIYPQTTTVYTGTATGAGGTANCTKTVNVAPSATGSISLSPTTILQGNTATLSWSTQNADQGVYITGIGWVSSSGSVQVGPSSNATYTLTAYGFGGNNGYSASLSVLAPCTQGGLTIPSGQSVTFYSQQSVAQGTTCASVSQTRTCTNGILSGSSSYQYGSCSCAVSSTYSCSGQTIQRADTNAACTTTTTNTTTCTSPAFCSSGSATCLYPPPSFTQSGSNTGHLQVHPQLVRRGGAANIFWNVDNVTDCTVTSPIDFFTGKTSGPFGQRSKPIFQQTVFTLSCAELDGSTIHETATAGVAPVFQER